MIDEDSNPIEDDQSPLDDQTDEGQDNGPEDPNLNKKSAEHRINELIAKTKELEAKLKDKESVTVATVPPAPAQPQPTTPEAQKIVESLKKLGFVTKKDQEDAVRTVQDRITLDGEHASLENRIDGSDGRPRYNRKEIEDFMRERGIYDAEAAYEIKNKKELADWNIKQYEENRGKRPFVQKPTSSGGERESQAITREKIAEWLKTPEGRIKYEQNREKILSMMAKNQL